MHLFSSPQFRPLNPLLLCGLLAACGGGQTPEEPATAPAAASGADSNNERMRALAAQPGSETALQPIKASASSQERPDLGADRAIDGRADTRWSSAFSDAQHLTLDYGRSVHIRRLQIDWENAHASSYQLLSSADGISWTVQRSVQDSRGGRENLSGLDIQTRYLRIQGRKRSTPYGYSIVELQAFSGTAADGPEPTPQPDPDPAQPGQAIKPVAATSSATENPGLSAAQAIDGRADTRWSSAADDRAWLQLDLGSVRALGSLKLVWEAAYGKAYDIQVSSDGQTWRTLRQVREGQGGVEELLNLSSQGRYLRIQGVQRATPYGYSLFEVEVKAPGSDNSLPEHSGAALPTVAADARAQPLYAAQPPLETLQFSLPDGTLITRFGNRAQNRHARERGEEWNEAGYGPNETLDPITGLPQDKGRGDFLNYVPQYFQHRSWGLEIIDNSKVAGVSRPTLRFNLYNNSIEFKNDTIAYFRAFDNPNVTGYGWMNGSNFASDPTQPFTSDRCAPVPFPVGPVPGRAICHTLVQEYPRHAKLDAAGMPLPGQMNEARPLRVGDLVEVSPSYFVEDAALRALGDPGNGRYYSGEWLYVVGQGLRPWYGVAPRLNSVPLPDHTLAGGSTTMSYNYSDNSNRVFEQPANNIGMQNMQRFLEGRRLLHTDFLSGQHAEPGNLPLPAAQNLAGPFFNKTSCVACHSNNGRSSPLNQLGQRLDSFSIKTAQRGSDGQLYPHARYGLSLQTQARSSSGSVQNWGQAVRVAGFERRMHSLADGTVVELSRPLLSFEGPEPELRSLRGAPPLIGVGLLEAVPEADILARVRERPDSDGVQGQANLVTDPETGQVRLGRFGWKAGKTSVRHQVAEAFLHDMSVTSPVYPRKSCHANSADCRSGPPQAGIQEADLQKVTQYLSLLAVPAQRSLASGFPNKVTPMAEHRVDEAQIRRGQSLFMNQAKCAACHTAELKTGDTHPLAELRKQTIRPFTDLLLHDMGAGLADTLAEGRASGRQWRTAPLWGLGYAPYVAEGEARVGYLHDGRARNLTEAILWHDGEAARSRQSFEQLSRSEREDLLAFLRSL